MILQTYTWEPALLAQALEAWQSITPVSFRVSSDRMLLDRAYAECEKLTAQHSRSFYRASSFLSREKRRAARALYAFCRVTDDIVDCPDCNAQQSLSEWRHIALTAEPPIDNLVAVAWADARQRYHIPLRLAEQLIDGVARDLDQTCYATFDDLAAYAYGVASTVGLMSMRIVGYNSPAAIPYAIKLGVALQLTNILRDVGEDWRMGRVYLPADELARFDLSADDLARGQVNDRWRAFMRFQIERNRRLYAEAWPGIELLNKDGRFAIAAAGDLYRRILDDIEVHDYDVFTRRARVSTPRKLLGLASLWWRTHEQPEASTPTSVANVWKRTGSEVLKQVVTRVDNVLKISKPQYDFIITGAGLAGLSLALHLINSPLRDRSILIVDHDTKERNDRTWSYWSDRPTLFDGLACRTWDRLHLAGFNGEMRVPLRRYRYRTIRGIDFYEYARQELAKHPNVTWLHGKVEAIEDGGGAARVVVNHERITGCWVFDSTQRRAASVDDARYHQLKLHFKGWEIETAQPGFDPSAATFLDFRTPQNGATRFFYVLPFDERHALVEYTLFSNMPLLPREYEQAMQTYLREVLKIDDYHITRQEGGVIPITDRPYPRQLSERATGRVMSIGMQGGRIKPSTGFAFMRVQADSVAIVQSLLEHDQPFEVPGDSERYRLYDSLLLDIMERDPERIQSIFAALFKRNSLEQVLSFLDERASLAQNVRMIATLPPAPFLQALVRVGTAKERVVEVA